MHLKCWISILGFRFGILAFFRFTNEAVEGFILHFSGVEKVYLFDYQKSEKWPMGEGKRKLKTALKEKFKKKGTLGRNSQQGSPSTMWKITIFYEWTKIVRKTWFFLYSVTEKNIKQNPNPLSLTVQRLLMLQVSTLSIKL